MCIAKVEINLRKKKYNKHLMLFRLYSRRKSSLQLQSNLYIKDTGGNLKM
jgi:hypothetical protein